MLLQTEVGRWGAGARYRPTYYLLRMLEASAWGKNPMLWYACRLVLVAIATILSWKMMSSILGKLGAGLLCMYALTFPYWSEFTGRLGPSETYVVLGLPIYIAGVAAVLRGRVKRPMARLLANGAILIGSIVSIGSKENLLLLAVPSAYLLVRGFRRRDWLLLGATSGSLLLAAWVAGGIVLSVSKTGMDIYDQPVALGQRLVDIVMVLRSRRWVTPFSVLVALTVAVAGLSSLYGWTRSQRISIRRAALWLASLCLVSGPQMVFYDAAWPDTVTRYGFPGLLYYPASILILFGMTRDLLAGYSTERAAWWALKGSLLVSLALVIIYHRGYSGSIRAIHESVAQTTAFTSDLERLVDEPRQDESVQLVIESSGILDYEPVYGYPRFLSAYQVRNPLLLRMTGYGSAQFPPGLGQRLAAELEAISRNGNKDFKPLSSLDEDRGRCLSFFLTVDYPTGCDAFR